MQQHFRWGLWHSLGHGSGSSEPQGRYFVSFPNLIVIWQDWTDFTCLTLQESSCFPNSGPFYNASAESKSFLTACKTHAKRSTGDICYITLLTFPDQSVSNSPKAGFNPGTSFISSTFLARGFPNCASVVNWFDCRQNWYNFHDNHVKWAGNINYGLNVALLFSPLSLSAAASVSFPPSRCI